MSRSVASPDAETPSYWPVFISWTISSEVFPILLLTWQPVACSNGWTQSTFGSLLPSSAYPAQLTRFNWPSPCPRLCCMATLGSAGVPPAALPPPPPPPPQAASVSAARTATTAARLRPMRYIPSPPCRRRSDGMARPLREEGLRVGASLTQFVGCRAESPCPAYPTCVGRPRWVGSVRA